MKRQAYDGVKTETLEERGEGEGLRRGVPKRRRKNEEEEETKTTRRGFTQMDGIDPAEVAAPIAGIQANGRGWSGPEPTRDASTGTLQFRDWPDFCPNMTPEEILRAGSFGGGYFRPIVSAVNDGVRYENVWKELPEEWLKGMDVDCKIRSETYDKTSNRYLVDCGAKCSPRRTDAFGQLYWEKKGWIQPQDPYGWFQWYCRFYQGRRSDDDRRQVARWCKCTGPTGRWKRNLIAKCMRKGTPDAWNDASVSPVVRQTLQHWAYRLTKADYEADKGVVRERGASYFPRAALGSLKRAEGK